uniref:superoxide dismutase n=1 Tax=Daphnia galeata TaxID=27404 RepID=A0A8J2RWU2_9CRUS|nr:unnamed protein product [Daphnia galeata]
MLSIFTLRFCTILFIIQWTRAVPVSDSSDLTELRDSVSKLWKALRELESEVRESFDIHAAIENHEHQVHHLGHEDNGHDIHHSERHLKHLEQVHGRTVAGPAGIEPHKPHTPDEKEVLRHEHEFHHANASFETEEEHKAHHDEKMLKHLELDHGHGEHNGIHHGKMNKEIEHEIDVHFMLRNHDGHAAHHNENLLKHLEDDDGHGPAADRPKPVTTPKPPRGSKTYQAVCEMKPNRALQRTKHNIVGKVAFTQTTGGPLNVHVNLRGLRTNGKSLHGLHVHELVPDEDGNCNQAGGHFNPTGSVHGGPKSRTRHVGDFGNVEAIENQGINAMFTDSVATLTGPNSILHRTLVIKEKEDDMGLNRDTESLANGNTGRRLACCIIRAV